MKRRIVIKNATAASSALYIVPSHVLGGKHIAPSDTLYVAAFGVGGRGGAAINNLHDTKQVEFVSLCDVDQARAAATFKKLPKAKQYKDSRTVYDQELKNIDA